MTTAHALSLSSLIATVNATILKLSNISRICNGKSIYGADATAGDGIILCAVQVATDVFH